MLPSFHLTAERPTKLNQLKNREFPNLPISTTQSSLTNLLILIECKIANPEVIWRSAAPVRPERTRTPELAWVSSEANALRCWKCE